MKVIKVLSLICFLTIGALAQQVANIKGILTAKNGKALANTEIKLEKDSVTVRQGSTDESGEYFLEGVPDGVYSFVFVDENGNTVREALVVSGGRDVTRVSGNRVNELVTISADTSQTIEQVSKTVNTIDAQEMRDRADFSLVESLRSIPGFRIQQLGGFGRTASIKTRGLRNQDTALLIDGLRFRDVASITGDASAFLSDFTLTSVSRIEVLRGSGSSLYGTNAIGGTIDFQTPKPTSGFHGNISGAGGGYGLKRFRANISDGTKDGKFGFNLGGSRTVYSEGIDGEDDAHNTNFQTRVESNPFAKTNISGRIFVTDAFVRLNSSPNSIAAALPVSQTTIVNAVPLSREQLRRFESGISLSGLSRGSANFIPDTNDPDNFQKSQSFIGQIALTQIISDRLFFRASYQGLRTSRKNDNGILGLGFQSPSTGIFKGTIQTINGQFNWTANRQNEATFGYEYERETYGNDGFTPSGTGNFFTRAYQTSNTIYAQDLLKFFGGKLQFAGGFRVQFFDLKTPEFSVTNAPYANVTLENPPNAYTFDGAGSYFFEKTRTKIRAHIGNGYRVPSLYERFGTFFSGFSQRFTALGDPNLKPERTIAFDGGVEQNLFDDRAKLSATYFYTKQIDVIGFAGGVPPIGNTLRTSGGYLNTKGGIARGGEFSGEIKATDSTDIFASYTFTNSDQRVPQVPAAGIIETLGIPKHQFTLVATQRLKRAWVNFDFLASSSYLGALGFPSYVYRFDGNRRADLTGGYNIPLKGEKFNLRVFGTIENLFGDDYYENGFRTFDRNARFGFSFGF